MQRVVNFDAPRRPISAALIVGMQRGAPAAPFKVGQNGNGGGCGNLMPRGGQYGAVPCGSPDARMCSDEVLVLTNNAVVTATPTAINAQGTNPFCAEKFIVDSTTAALFTITNFQISNQNQTSGSLAATGFSAQLFNEGAAQIPRLRATCIKDGTTITLTVTQNTGVNQRFSAALVGPALPVM